MTAEPNKNTGRSFLDKFQGKANKVGRSGIHAILKSTDNSLTNIQQNQQPQFRKVDLDQLIPSNPERNNPRPSLDAIVKRRQSLSKPPVRTSHNPDYVPSAYTPQSSSKEETLPHYPPSRSLSNSTDGARGKYIFGKYLKLDKEALSHIDFLHSVQAKAKAKRSISHSQQLI